jgi:hypothetical protein
MGRRPGSIGRRPGSMGRRPGSMGRRPGSIGRRPVRWDDGPKNRSDDRGFRSDDVCPFLANAPKFTGDVHPELDVLSSFRGRRLLTLRRRLPFLGRRPPSYGRRLPFRGRRPEARTRRRTSLGRSRITWRRRPLLEGVVSSLSGDAILFSGDVSFFRHDGRLFIAVVAFLGDDVPERLDDGQEHRAALHSRFESVERQFADRRSILAVVHKKNAVLVSPSAARSFLRPNPPWRDEDLSPNYGALPRRTRGRAVYVRPPPRRTRGRAVYVRLEVDHLRRPVPRSIGDPRFGASVRERQGHEGAAKVMSPQEHAAWLWYRELGAVHFRQLQPFA